MDFYNSNIVFIFFHPFSLSWDFLVGQTPIENTYHQNLAITLCLGNMQTII
jgi:hypothetical protein